MSRRLIVMRHGERVDFLFGDNWVNECFNATSGVYIPHNLNMPTTLIRREGSPYSFRKDTPLTQVGLLQGKLVGQGLRLQNLVRPDFEVYSSPALRSIQTAASLLEGKKKDWDCDYNQSFSSIVTEEVNQIGLNATHTQIKVEPSLFEWTGWYSDAIPSWATLDELLLNGYNIDTSYDSFMGLPGKPSGLEVPETYEAFYIRSKNFVNNVLHQSSSDVILVGHGASLDACTRNICGHPDKIPSQEEMLKILRTVPYAATVIAEQESNSKKWRILKPMGILIRHSAVNDFEAHRVLSAGIE